ncbi:PTS transporter subunit EIIB [Miniimonas sp. S16]|uniref:PTS transporter subunit EIIB n=1 Tax=Miniimonas sp. S16 TaxID=2171623 RepID=UPI000D529FEC
MDKTTQLASDLLEQLGGADNIVAVENCMTRMRVTPRDPRASTRRRSSGPRVCSASWTTRPTRSSSGRGRSAG